MESRNYDETSLNYNQNDIAIQFFNTLEKIAGIKVLDTQSDYDTLYDFSLKIINLNEIENKTTENPINNIYLTAGQMEKFIQEIKHLTNGI